MRRYLGDYIAVGYRWRYNLCIISILALVEHAIEGEAEDGGGRSRPGRAERGAEVEALVAALGAG